MAKAKKQRISTHFERLTVVVNPATQPSGIGEFDVAYFSPNEHYRVLATYLKEWDDRSTTAVFLIEGPGGAIVEKACSKFLVAEVT